MFGSIVQLGNAKKSFRIHLINIYNQTATIWNAIHPNDAKEKHYNHADTATTMQTKAISSKVDKCCMSVEFRCKI